MAEKDQKPTAKRLRDARKRGDVVYSSDVSSAVSFVVVVAMLWLMGTTAFSLLRELWRHATSETLFADPSARMPELLRHTGEVLLWGTIPLMAVAALAAIAACFFQVGALAAWEKLKPDVSRLNPAQGFQRIFSARNLINLLKMVVKTLLLGALMFVVIRGLLASALKLGYTSPPVVMAVGGQSILILFGWAAVIYVAMAALDYVHQHHEFMKQHRMSIQELRQEYKEVQGDPVNTARRRSAHFEAVYASVGDRVRSASAVIHSASTAVALQYFGERDLPRVIARGEGDMAAQIRRFAAEAAVPMEFDAQLAGRLYDEVPLDRPIPRSLYAPVATLLRWATGQD